MTHWAAQYIGLRWRLGAAGPEAFDCWHFARHIQSAHYGRSLPDAGYTGDAKLSTKLLNDPACYADWTVQAQPQDGDCVLMSKNKLLRHIGVWLNAGGVLGALHCIQGAGVVFQPASELAHHGWTSLVFVRPLYA